MSGRKKSYTPTGIERLAQSKRAKQGIPEPKIKIAPFTIRFDEYDWKPPGEGKGLWDDFGDIKKIEEARKIFYQEMHKITPQIQKIDQPKAPDATDWAEDWAKRQ